MRFRSFGHDCLQGTFAKRIGNNKKKRFGHSTLQRSPTTHAVTRLWLFTFYGYTVYIMVQVGATWSMHSSPYFLDICY